MAAIECKRFVASTFSCYSASKQCINQPLHPDIKLIKAKKIEKFSYDPRLVGQP